MSTDPALSELFEFLRYPSVSTDPARRDSVRDCADWLARKLSSIGLEAVVYPTPGHPVVVARNETRPGLPTVLIYGHYDVQPVDPLELWEQDPFKPFVRDGRIIARGATDNKGQILAHILGVEKTVREHGTLPVNLIFLIEGEEEIGSPNLGPFLQQHRQELACDIVAISDTGMVAPGLPTLTCGLRGIAALEMTLHGPDKDLHSGIYGGAVANPITELCRLLATLHDENGRVAVAGFYDRVREIPPAERKAWTELPLGDKELLQLTGSPALCGESGYSAIERTWARPTVELNGISGGYQGEGSKTVLPAKASAKLTFRLVPDQDPANILQLVSDHLKKHCPQSVRMELHAGHSGKPYLLDPESRYGLAARRALSKAFGGKKPALIREGGSIPIVASFREILGADTLLLGLALPDCRAHSPNENFPVENFLAGQRLNQELLQELAALSAAI